MDETTPVRARSCELHDAVLAHDPTASVKIAEEILPDVVEALRKKHFRVARRDEHPLLESAVDAFFEYMAAASRFDPGRLDLYGYLLMAADRNFRNNREKEQVRRKYEGSVELIARDRNDNVASVLAERDEQERDLSLIPGGTIAEKIKHILPDPADQKICMLMLQGERKSEVFAQELGLSGDKGAIRREVKRHKDRITKILQRFREHAHGG